MPTHKVRLLTTFLPISQQVPGVRFEYIWGSVADFVLAFWSQEGFTLFSYNRLLSCSHSFLQALVQHNQMPCDHPGHVLRQGIHQPTSNEIKSPHLPASPLFLSHSHWRKQPIKWKAKPRAAMRQGITNAPKIIQHLRNVMKFTNKLYETIHGNFSP